LTLGGTEPELSEELKRNGLQPIVGEIKWGREDGDGTYRHGLAIKNLSADQRALFAQLLRRHAMGLEAAPLKRAFG
jgi:hypothetical protein